MDDVPEEARFSEVLFADEYRDSNGARIIASRFAHEHNGEIETREYIRDPLSGRWSLKNVDSMPDTDVYVRSAKDHEDKGTDIIPLILLRSRIALAEWSETLCKRQDYA